MLVAKDLFEKIDLVMERAYLGFAYLIVGDDFFTVEQKRQVEAMGLIIGRKPLIEILYLLVRQRSEPGYQSDLTLQQLLNEIIASHALPVLNDVQWQTVHQAKQSAFEMIQDEKRVLTKKVKQTALAVNDQLRKEELLGGMPAPQDRQKRDSEALALILGLVGISIAQARQDFIRNAVAMVTNLIANGVLDTAISRLGVFAGDLEVYKTVINDSGLCQWCDGFYVNQDGTPTIYTAKALLANGSNYGKPKSEWLPTLGSTHPNCRCTLHYVGQK